MNTNLKPNSLQLLSTYESDSEEDEDISSNTSSVISCNSTIKRPSNDSNSDTFSIKKLPLPTFLTEKENFKEYGEDSSSHGGRIRSFPHERGNWATYIYLPYHGNEYITELIKGVANLCSPIAKLEIVNDFHISLTKTVVLKYHWIESFINTVRKKITINSLKSFQIFFNNVEVYTNEEKTRTFLGLNIYAGYDHLNDAVNIFNECLEEFKLNSFYEDPSFHMSILWCVGDKKNELNSILHEINKFVSNFMENCTDTDWKIDAKYFICKSGNKQFIFNLS